MSPTILQVFKGISSASMLLVTCRNADAGSKNDFSRTKQHKMQNHVFGVRFARWPRLCADYATDPLVFIDVHSHADAQACVPRELTFMLCPATIRMARLFPKEASCWKNVVAQKPLRPVCPAYPHYCGLTLSVLCCWQYCHSAMMLSSLNQNSSCSALKSNCSKRTHP